MRAPLSLAEQQAFERGCLGKEQFITEAAATAALKLYLRDRSFQRRGSHKLHAYHCNFCESWHIGHD